MADILIRNVPRNLHSDLKTRAARDGHTLSDEAVAALRRGLRSVAEAGVRPGAAERLQSIVREMYGGHPPTGVVDDLIAERRRDAAMEEDAWRRSKA